MIKKTTKSKRLKRLKRLMGHYSKMSAKELANHPQYKRMRGEYEAEQQFTNTAASTESRRKAAIKRAKPAAKRKRKAPTSTAQDARQQERLLGMGRGKNKRK